MNIKTTTVTQTGNEVLGTKEKSLYYLIVENILGTKLVINVGEKTHDGVKEMITREENLLKAEEEAKAQTKIEFEEQKEIKEELEHLEEERKNKNKK